MIPYLLAAIGGYLIGDSMKTPKYSDGGKVAWNPKTNKYENIQGFVVRKNGKEILKTKRFNKAVDFSVDNKGEMFVIYEDGTERKLGRNGGMMAEGGIFEYQVLIFDENNDIVISEHYEEEPSDLEINNALKEGLRAEVYLVKGDDYSKLISTYEYSDEYKKGGKIKIIK